MMKLKEKKYVLLNNNATTSIGEIIIKHKHKYYNEADNLCWLSKNLYNSTLYSVRQYYFENKKFLKYQVVNKMYVDTNNPDYRALPAKVAKHTQMLVEQNFKSFFGLLKLKGKGKYDKPVKIPKYLNKKTGRQVVHYEKDYEAIAYRCTHPCNRIYRPTCHTGSCCGFRLYYYGR